MGPPGRSVALCGAPRALRLPGASGVATPSSRPRLSGALSRVESCAGTVSGVGSCPHHYIDVCVHFRRVWSDLNDVDTFGPALSAACLLSPERARGGGAAAPRAGPRAAPFKAAEAGRDLGQPEARPELQEASGEPQLAKAWHRHVFDIRYRGAARARDNRLCARIARLRCNHRWTAASPCE